MALLTEVARRHRRERLAWAAMGAVGTVALAIAFAFLPLDPEKPALAASRFTVETPGNGSLPLFGRPTVSPDGQSVLFAVIDTADGGPVWYLHRFATATSTIIPGTENIIAVGWSFDSQSVLLRRDGVLSRMDLKTGSRQRLPVTGAYSSWQREGIVAGGQRGLQWFSADGSGSRWIKKRDHENGIAYSYPSLIPGGRWLLYNAEDTDDAATGFSVHLASLDNKVDREISKADRPTIYVGPGYLLSLRDNWLMAQGIDPKNGTLLGAPTPIAGPIGTSEVTADRLGPFSASDNGVLAFRTGAVSVEQKADHSFSVIVNWPSLLKK